MSALMRLFANKSDVIVQENFLTAAEIARFLAALAQQPDWLASLNPKIEDRIYPDMDLPPHLFESQYAAIARGWTEQAYLTECLKYGALWQSLTDRCGFDPFTLFKNHLKQNYHIDLQPAARSGSPYFPVMVRDFAQTILPHADFGPFDGPGWAIDAVQQQLAWNIYLTQPDTGGDTTVYDCFWDGTQEHDPASYGIANFNKPIKAEFSVAKGKLVLFNSRNFHAVAESSSPRIAIGGLIGLTQQGNIIAWC